MSKRKSQIGKPTENPGWTIEMDPTNSLITALTGNVPHQPRATAQNNTTVLQCLRGLQPSVSNGFVSSITAEHTTSQTICSPLPSSVQFDNNSDAGHVSAISFLQMI
jgi:hypothetical protein